MWNKDNLYLLQGLSVVDCQNYWILTIPLGNSKGIRLSQFACPSPPFPAAPLPGFSCPWRRCGGWDSAGGCGAAAPERLLGPGTAPQPQNGSSAPERLLSSAEPPGASARRVAMLPCESSTALGIRERRIQPVPNVSFPYNVKSSEQSLPIFI